jgi:hypothetical protein
MPNQFNGQVLLDNGKPIPRLEVEIDYPGRTGDRIFTLTNNKGEWNITLDVEVNPIDLTIRFYGDGYETKIIKNPQLTEILRGFIDPEKGGTLDLTGKYEKGKYQFEDLSNENQGLIYQEIKDMWRFVTYNYGNYTLTIDATETRDEKNEDTSIELQLPGLLAEARRDELKRILDNQFYQYFLEAKSKTGGGYALINSNADIPHQPKIELGNIDVVEGVKPGAKIKLNFIQPPLNVPIPNNEEEFIQLLINSGFTKISTQDKLTSTFGDNSDISVVEYVYYNYEEDTFVIKAKSNPNSPSSKGIIRLERRGIFVPVNEQITNYTKYGNFTFDTTNPRYEELKPNIQNAISAFIINIQRKSNLQSLDKESLIKRIEGISNNSIHANPAYKETLQRIINGDVKSAKKFIENSPLGDQPELYNRLSKQRDIILSNGFSVDIIW